MAHSNYVEYVSQYNADIVQTRSNCSVRITNEGEVCFVDHGTRFHYNRARGPADIRPTGVTMWYCNNMLHREDGPAVVYSPVNKVFYYLNDKRIDDLTWFVTKGNF